jgi:hypothetical protein
MHRSIGEHAKAALRRLSGAGYTGARVTQGAIKDYVVASDGRSVSRGGATLTAEAAVFRRNGNKTSFYFIRRGLAFDGGDGRGVISDQPVSVHLRGKSGSIMATANSVVTFRYPGIRAITIDGQKAVATRVPGGIRAAIPPGRHTVALS